MLIKDFFDNTFEIIVPHRSRRRKERQTHYRAHIASICYPEISNGLIKTGIHNMPVIRPNRIIPKVIDTTPFDKILAKNSNKDSLVMFYINDDRFAHRLTHPWTYTNELLRYKGVIAPDLSQYIDMDYAERMSNNYWNKVFTVYWQNQNVNIYPNVTWSLPDSYEYSLEGYPCESVIAINSMGVKQSNFSTSQWLDGYWYMTKALKPICILRYGPKIYGEDESLSIYLDNKQIIFFEDGRKRK
jgi:hypothetical protein